MENKVLITVDEISKKYKLYNKPFDRLKELADPFRRQYHRDFWALRDISFEVRRGESVGIIGVNGSGKSTLLQIICGILKPTKGQVEVNGRISALLELGSGFNPELPGRDNVYLQGAMLGYSPQEMKRKFNKIVEFADIGDFLDQPVKTYSSGMMIRLAFAVAIQIDPEILIVDEALSVGDVFFQSKCFRRIEELCNKGVTILFVSHQLSTIQSVCQKAILLDKGRIVCQGDSRTTVEAYIRHIATLHGARDMATIQEDIRIEKEVKETVAAEDHSKDNLGDERFSATNRYGTGKARLLKYVVNDLNNCKQIVVQSAASLKIRLSYKTHARIEKPFVAIRINTVTGVQIYGNNTTFANVSLESCSKGDEIEVEFEQYLYLNQGSYLLTFAFAEWGEHGKVIHIDRFVDAVHINVAGGPYPYAGICNFQGKVTVLNHTKQEA